jgi:hypothetical protein
VTGESGRRPPSPVSQATAHRWWHRWSQAGEQSRARSRVSSIARAVRAARLGAGVVA